MNELIRRGLANPDSRKQFRQKASAMGDPLLPLDDVAGLLDVLDGPASR